MLGSTEIVVFDLFFYASFGSPNIHLSLLVSKFTVAQGGEAFGKKWSLPLHELKYQLD